MYVHVLNWEILTGPPDLVPLSSRLLLCWLPLWPSACLFILWTCWCCLSLHSSVLHTLWNTLPPTLCNLIPISFHICVRFHFFLETSYNHSAQIQQTLMPLHCPFYPFASCIFLHIHHCFWDTLCVHYVCLPSRGVRSMSAECCLSCSLCSPPCPGGGRGVSACHIVGTREVCAEGVFAYRILYKLSTKQCPDVMMAMQFVICTRTLWRWQEILSLIRPKR